MPAPAEETTESQATAPAIIDETKLLEVLATMRPYLQADGGDVEYVGTTAEGVVQVRLQGACGTCPSSIYTLKMGIEEQLKMHVAGVTAVEQVQ
ncbi:MAG: NifU family protein [Vampirovibrionales bacterium]|nr:NifU family protein [Vampirovibrionales bacterium]